jgi:hypothetical protein
MGRERRRTRRRHLVTRTIPSPPPSASCRHPLQCPLRARPPPAPPLPRGQTPQLALSSPLSLNRISSAPTPHLLRSPSCPADLLCISIPLICSLQGGGPRRPKLSPGHHRPRLPLHQLCLPGSILPSRLTILRRRSIQLVRHSTTHHIFPPRPPGRWPRTRRTARDLTFSLRPQTAKKSKITSRQRCNL